MTSQKPEQYGSDLTEEQFYDKLGGNRLYGFLHATADEKNERNRNLGTGNDLNNFSQMTSKPLKPRPPSPSQPLMYTHGRPNLRFNPQKTDKELDLDNQIEKPINKEDNNLEDKNLEKRGRTDPNNLEDKNLEKRGRLDPNLFNDYDNNELIDYRTDLKEQLLNDPNNEEIKQEINNYYTILQILAKIFLGIAVSSSLIYHVSMIIYSLLSSQLLILLNQLITG